MKLLDLQPKYLNCDIVKLICLNKELKKRYIQKYNTFFNIKKCNLKKYKLMHYGGVEDYDFQQALQLTLPAKKAPGNYGFIYKTATFEKTPVQYIVPYGENLLLISILDSCDKKTKELLMVVINEKSETIDRRYMVKLPINTFDTSKTDAEFIQYFEKPVYKWKPDFLQFEDRTSTFIEIPVNATINGLTSVKKAARIDGNIIYFAKYGHFVLMAKDINGMRNGKILEDDGFDINGGDIRLFSMAYNRGIKNKLMLCVFNDKRYQIPLMVLPTYYQCIDNLRGNVDKVGLYFVTPQNVNQLLINTMVSNEILKVLNDLRLQYEAQVLRVIHPFNVNYGNNPMGLINYDADCFMICVMQCLLHNNYLIQFFIKECQNLNYIAETTHFCNILRQDTENLFTKYHNAILEPEFIQIYLSTIRLASGGNYGCGVQGDSGEFIRDLLLYYSGMTQLPRDYIISSNLNNTYTYTAANLPQQFIDRVVNQFEYLLPFTEDIPNSIITNLFLFRTYEIKDKSIVYRAHEDKQDECESNIKYSNSTHILMISTKVNFTEQEKTFIKQSESGTFKYNDEIHTNELVTMHIDKVMLEKGIQCSDVYLNKVTYQARNIIKFPRCPIIQLNRQETISIYDTDNEELNIFNRMEAIAAKKPINKTVKIITPNLVIDEVLIIDNKRYSLYGACVHHGAQGSSGHYTAYVKLGNNTWYDCNDSRVTPVHGDINTFPNIKEVFLLFYVRILDEGMLHPESDINIDLLPEYNSQYNLNIQINKHEQEVTRHIDAYIQSLTSVIENDINPFYHVDVKNALNTIIDATNIVANPAGANPAGANPAVANPAGANPAVANPAVTPLNVNQQSILEQLIPMGFSEEKSSEAVLRTSTLNKAIQWIADNT